MIINFSIPLLFFKTRKTASTSVEAALEQSFWGVPASHGKKASIYPDGFVTGRPTNVSNRLQHGILIARVLKQLRSHGLSIHQCIALTKLGPHSHVSEVMSILPRSFFVRATKVAVVRNPWDKVVSDYFFSTRYPVLRRKTRENFEEFASRALPAVVESEIVEYQDKSWRICLYEELPFALKAVISETGGERTELPRFKAGIRPPNFHYSRLYTSQSREVVERNWAPWISYFGYQFESK